MESVHGRQHARSSRRSAAELQRGLDSLRAGAGEQHPRQPVGRARQERLREQAREQRDPELDRAGRLELERLDERRPDARVIPPDVEHAEAPEQVQKTVAVRVVQVLPLGARPGAVEADRLEHAREPRIDGARV